MSSHGRTLSAFSRVLLGAVAAASLLATPSVEAQKQKRISTHDPKVAGPDWLVQGDYIGRLSHGGADEMYGVQVIARGSGNFEATGYRGGLPGTGWDRKTRVHYKGKTSGNTTVLTADYAPAPQLVLSKKTMMVFSKNASEELGRLERVVRRSPTLGMAPPDGALVLFDGSTAEHFETKRGKKTPEITSEGALRLPRGSGGLFTKKAFADCRIHVEFRLPFEPQGRGQGRSNSGCYLQGRYEVQILDSFGLRGRENECGGVYSSGRDPAVNMCFPPMTWQTFDIEFRAARYKDGKKVEDARLDVLHNGFPVYTDLVIDHSTTASPFKEGPEKKPHYLQDHGHELHYRNIWILER